MIIAKAGNAPPMTPRIPLIALALLVAAATQADALDARHPGADRFIEDMVNNHQLDRARLVALLSDAERKDSIIRAMTRPAEAKPWHEYRKIFVTPQRVAGGVVFIQNNQQLLERVEAEFGVPVALVAAIIGVETRYGEITGSFRVLDALATLAFHYPPRAEFFRRELAEFLLLSSEEQLPVDEVLGSYAGAMGIGQFIPSSYRAYAVDFDGDGRRDLWSSPADAIASVANYFKVHKWRSGEPVVVPARASEDARQLETLPLDPQYPLAQLVDWGYQPATGPADPQRLATLIELEASDGPEYWIGFHNFYVISRYNRSALYSMAVYQLSEAIARATGRTVAGR